VEVAAAADYGKWGNGQVRFRQWLFRVVTNTRFELFIMVSSPLLLSPSSHHPSSRHISSPPVILPSPLIAGVHRAQRAGHDLCALR
jgi:hypothetical protein